MEVGEGIVVDVSSRLQRKVDKIATLPKPERHYPTDDVVKEIPEGVYDP